MSHQRTDVEVARGPISVLVCRGCCCGTAGQSPAVDHDGQLERLRTATETVKGSKLRTVDCLGPCERANVVVVRRGSTRWWLGDVVDDAQVDTLAEWLTDPAGDPPAGLVFERPRPTRQRQLAMERGDDLADWLTTAIGQGRWSVGVYGAVGEFRPERPQIERAGNTVTASTPTAALRVAVDDHTRLFTFGQRDEPAQPWAELLVRTGAGVEPNAVVTALGPDHDSIDSSACDGQLFDLGVGRSLAAFMVRTTDSELHAMLSHIAGTAWADLDPSLIAEIVSASPTRVVTTGLGRVEISAPIPSTAGGSRSGSRARLHSDRLELGQDWPAGFDVPTGWTSGIAHYLDSD